jgi:NADH:ubiquinone oxidoreductase subunit K
MGTRIGTAWGAVCVKTGLCGVWYLKRENNAPAGSAWSASHFSRVACIKTQISIYGVVMIEAVIYALIYIALLALVVYLVLWVTTDVLGLPLPPKVVTIIWVIVALIVISVGGPPGRTGQKLVENRHA